MVAFAFLHHDGIIASVAYAVSHLLRIRGDRPGMATTGARRIDSQDKTAGPCGPTVRKEARRAVYLRPPQTHHTPVPELLGAMVSKAFSGLKPPATILDFTSMSCRPPQKGSLLKCVLQSRYHWV